MRFLLWQQFCYCSSFCHSWSISSCSSHCTPFRQCTTRYSVATVWVSFKSMFEFLVSGHVCLAVSQQVQSVPVCVISVLVTDNFMLSSLHFEECENHLKYFSFHINLLPCYASHHLKQVHFLAVQVILFCLRIIRCNKFMQLHTAHWHSTHAEASTLLQQPEIEPPNIPIRSRIFYVPHLIFSTPPPIFYIPR